MNTEKIVILGYGWVGQANALALTTMGYKVFYYDIVHPKLHYADSYSHIYDEVKPLSNPLEQDGPDTWYIISVGDRVKENGYQDISLIEQVNGLVKNNKGGIILRSTVLPQNLKKFKFDYYVPEFLHEKQAVEECITPFYFVIGKKSDRLEPSFFKEWRKRAYKVFEGTPEEASYVKYLSNIWNSLRIAFINEYGSLVKDPSNPEHVKDIDKVIDFVFGRKHYLKYGRSYGGHCLPKDTLAFFTAHAPEKNVAILKAVHESNLAHKEVENRHQHLPEWFSGWTYDLGISAAPGMNNTIFKIWNSVNNHPAVKSARSQLRFLIRGVQQLIPNKSLTDLRGHWNRLAKENARYFVNPLTPSGKEATEFELKETGMADYEKYLKNDPVIKNRLGSFNDKSVLDLGCGVGRITEYMANDFKKVHALDLSEEMIESAKKRVIGKKNVEFHIGNGNSIPLEKQNVDLVFSYQTFQHLPNESLIKDYLEEICRVLKPGGVAKIHLRTGLGTYKWRWFYGVAVTPEFVEGISKKAGFKSFDYRIEGVKNLWVTLNK